MSDPHTQPHGGAVADGHPNAAKSSSWPAASFLPVSPCSTFPHHPHSISNPVIHNRRRSSHSHLPTLTTSYLGSLRPASSSENESETPTTVASSSVLTPQSVMSVYHVAASPSRRVYDWNVAQDRQHTLLKPKSQDSLIISSNPLDSPTAVSIGQPIETISSYAPHNTTTFDSTLSASRSISPSAASVTSIYGSSYNTCFGFPNHPYPHSCQSEASLSSSFKASNDVYSGVPVAMDAIPNQCLVTCQQPSLATSSGQHSHSCPSPSSPLVPSCTASSRPRDLSSVHDSSSFSVLEIRTSAVEITAQQLLARLQACRADRTINGSAPTSASSGIKTELLHHHEVIRSSQLKEYHSSSQTKRFGQRISNDGPSNHMAIKDDGEVHFGYSNSTLPTMDLNSDFNPATLTHYNLAAFPTNPASHDYLDCQDVTPPSSSLSLDFARQQCTATTTLVKSPSQPHTLSSSMRLPDGCQAYRPPPRQTTMAPLPEKQRSLSPIESSHHLSDSSAHPQPSTPTGHHFDHIYTRPSSSLQHSSTHLPTRSSSSLVPIHDFSSKPFDTHSSIPPLILDFRPIDQFLGSNSFPTSPDVSGHVASSFHLHLPRLVVRHLYKSLSSQDSTNPFLAFSLKSFITTSMAKKRFSETLHSILDQDDSVACTSLKRPCTAEAQSLASHETLCPDLKQPLPAVPATDNLYWKADVVVIYRGGDDDDGGDEKSHHPNSDSQRANLASSTVIDSGSDSECNAGQILIKTLERVGGSKSTSDSSHQSINRGGGVYFVNSDLDILRDSLLPDYWVSSSSLSSSSSSSSSIQGLPLDEHSSRHPTDHHLSGTSAPHNPPSTADPSGLTTESQMTPRRRNSSNLIPKFNESSPPPSLSTTGFNRPKRPTRPSLARLDTSERIQTVILNNDDIITQPSHFQISTILPGFLYLGPNIQSQENVNQLLNLGVKTILNMALEIEKNQHHQKFQNYFKIPMKDSIEDSQVLHSIKQAFVFLDQAKLDKTPIYIHCQAGKSRSVTIVIAYLIHSLHWSLDQSYSYVVEKRKQISPNIGFVAELVKLEAEILKK